MSTKLANIRLPDEVVTRIFRNSIFSRTDLYNCALVSRKFANLAQAFLFAEVDVVILQDSVGDKANSTYSTRTWTGLRCLIENAELRKYVTTLRIEVVKNSERTSSDDTSHLGTTPLLTLSTFLDLAPKVNSIPAQSRSLGLSRTIGS